MFTAALGGKVAKNMQKVKKYVKKIGIYIIIIVTGIALYILLSRSNTRTAKRIDNDIDQIRDGNKRIKQDLDRGENNAAGITEEINRATENNRESFNFVQRLEANNKRFRRLLEELQK